MKSTLLRRCEITERKMPRRNLRSLVKTQVSEEKEDYNEPSTSQGTRHKRSQVASQSQFSNLSQSSDIELSQRQNSRSSPSKILTSDEENVLVNNVLQYLLIVSETKEAIQRAHIIKNVLGGRSRIYNGIMEKVAKVLADVFGYRLVDIDDRKLMVVNMLENNYLSCTDDETPSKILLFLVLSNIFMSSNECTEGELLEFLRLLDIVKDENFLHVYFGDVKQLITSVFVKQQYLDRSINEEHDPPKCTYKWGLRAKYELSPRSVMEFVSEVYGGEPMENWTDQFARMQAWKTP